MTDSTSNTGSPDRDRINVPEDYEVPDRTKPRRQPQKLQERSPESDARYF